MLPQEIIRKKRDGGELTEHEIKFLVHYITGGGFSDSQVAAFAMAVYFRGMTLAERIAMTRAMTNSGAVMEWEGLDGPVLDKHSTGGVGDKVSLMLAPMVAACGGYVPMISGRALGHTGGTLDKLGAIPGYRAVPDVEALSRVVRDVGCAIIGQTPRLAPADQRLYAIRDVTATVESIPLICTSILSKKLAAGLEGLVMDVKYGSGAFMKELKDATELAETIVSIAAGAGLPTVALLTDMDQVLGATAGNALEVAEAVDYLTGRAREARLHAVTLALAGEMLALGKLAASPKEGRAKAQAALDSGAAAERFSRMVAALGGPADFVERSEKYLAHARVTMPFPAPASGYVAAMDTHKIGLGVADLGGGRHKTEDKIDHAVGFAEFRPIGTPVKAGDPIAVVHATDGDRAAQAVAALAEAITVSDAPPEPLPLIHARIAR